MKRLLLSLILILAFVPHAEAAKVYVFVKMCNGSPCFAQETSDYRASVWGAGVKGNWAIYMVSGSGAQLLALQERDDFYAVCLVNELDQPLREEARSKLNQFIIDHNLHESWQIPEDMTGREVVIKTFRFVKVNYDISRHLIIGPEDD